MSDRFQQLRLIEALLFASAEPLGAAQLARHLPEGVDLDGLMAELSSLYANRGVTLVKVGSRWALRTAPDVAPLLQIETTAVRKPSRAAVETLAIIAYHQPVTRAEIEQIRGVALSRGTLDTLLDAGWVKPKGRRRTPGRPVTWGTTEAFLDHFGLESLDSLPGMAELRAAGLLDTRPAITALGSRGHLPVAGEPAEDSGEDAAEDDSRAEEAPLAADFGEDLVPADTETVQADDNVTDSMPDSVADDEDDNPGVAGPEPADGADLAPGEGGGRAVAAAQPKAVLAAGKGER